MNSEEENLIKWSEPNWLLKVDFVQLEKLSAMGFSPDQCAMFFDIPKPDFMYYFMLIDSKLKYHYDRGLLYHKALEGMNMLSDSETGENVTNAQRLDKLRKEIEFANSKNSIIYGDI